MSPNLPTSIIRFFDRAQAFFAGVIAVTISLVFFTTPTLASYLESWKFSPDPQDETFIFVDIANPACNNQNPGSEAAPLCNIQSAADRATPGTIIFVKGGEYHEMVRVRVSGQPGALIKFIAYEDQPVVIDSPEGAAFDLRNVEYIKIHGFELRGAWMDAPSHQNTTDIDPGHAGGIRSYPLDENGFGVRNSIFTYNIIHNNDAGIHLAVSDNNIIANNVIFHSGEAPIRIKRGHDNVITNNLTFNNGTRGEHWGITFYCAHGTQIYHNTSVELAGGAVFIYEGTSNLGGTQPGEPGFCIPSSPTTIYDNIGVTGGIITFTAPLVIGSSTTTDRPDRITLLYGELDNHYHHNLFYNLNNPQEMVSWGDPAESFSFPFYALLNLATFQQKSEGYGAASLAVDPRFIDPLRGDFRLASNSPARGEASDGSDMGVNFASLPPYERYAHYQWVGFLPALFK